MWKTFFHSRVRVNLIEQRSDHNWIVLIKKNNVTSRLGKANRFKHHHRMSNEDAAWLSRMNKKKTRIERRHSLLANLSKPCGIERHEIRWRAHVPIRLRMLKNIENKCLRASSNQVIVTILIIDVDYRTQIAIIPNIRYIFHHSLSNELRSWPGIFEIIFFLNHNKL